MKQILSSLILLCILCAQAQKENQLADFVSGNSQQEFSIDDFRWMENGAYYSLLEEGSIYKYHTLTGTVRDTIFYKPEYQLPGEIDCYFFSDDQKKILLQTESSTIIDKSFEARYFLMNTGTKSVKPLAEGKQS